MGNEQNLVAGMSYGTMTDKLQKMKEYAAKIGGSLGYKEATICIFDKKGNYTHTQTIQMVGCRGEEDLNKGLPNAIMYIHSDFENNVSESAMSNGKIKKVNTKNQKAVDKNGDGIIQDDEIEKKLNVEY